MRFNNFPRKYYVSFDELTQTLGQAGRKEWSTNSGLRLLIVKTQTAKDKKKTLLILNEQGQRVGLLEGDKLGYDVEGRIWVVKGPASIKNPLRKILANYGLPQRLLSYSNEELVVPWGDHCWACGDVKWIQKIINRDGYGGFHFSSWKVSGGKILFFFKPARYSFDSVRIESIVVRSNCYVEGSVGVFEWMIRVLRNEDGNSENLEEVIRLEDEQRESAEKAAIAEFLAKEENERAQRQAEAEAKWAAEKTRQRRKKMLEFVAVGFDKLTFKLEGVTYSVTPHKAGAKYAVFTRRNGNAIDEIIETDTLIENGVIEKWALACGFKG
ncbi:MAG: hypothetical protein Q7R86_00515 [bacterium]|nr:hypothetical protein [bacterium]